MIVYDREIDTIISRLRNIQNPSPFILGAICALEAVTNANHAPGYSPDPVVNTTQVHEEILVGAGL